MKKIATICVCVFLHTEICAQMLNWQNKDLETDSVFGISVEKAYNMLLKRKTGKKIIIAVVDSGIDTLHEDLQPVLWKGAENRVYGWNFIGGVETGKEDVTLLAGNKKEFYDSLSFTVVPEVYRAEYQNHRRCYPELSKKINALQKFIKNLTLSKKIADSIVTRIGNAQPVLLNFTNYTPLSTNEEIVLKHIVEKWRLYGTWEKLKFYEIENLIAQCQHHIDHGLNVKSQEKDSSEGNRDVAPDAMGLFDNSNLTACHGTHVAGIIGAARNNGIGINGVADNVEIMALKVVGNIRELRDRNLADAIYYAVDNGALIINLSFGKQYSWDKRAVDNAVKYAVKHDVLIIHGAGNSGQNLDVTEYYPNPVYKDNGGRADAWIEVGASGFKDDETLLAAFSNYGKGRVDVFAPGVKIYSTIPGSKYDTWSGTSMAAPVVAGLAALIRGYYPKLTAVQVKEIIMKSVVKKDILKEKCVSGGVVNAYNALKLAAVY
jgi:cell wall-associated protease